MADMREYSTDNCSVMRAVTVLGEKWTLPILRDVFLGVRRFDDLQRRTGAPRQVLSDRLSRLVDAGVLRRQDYREQGQRTRYEYRLTDAGRELFPVLTALREWGDRWLADDTGPALLLEHRDCGEPVRVEMRCAAGHRIDSPSEAEAMPGPGARRIA
jgi:DNA-binding HxlR family transcriptional regulator